MTPEKDHDDHRPRRGHYPLFLLFLLLKTTSGFESLPDLDTPRSSSTGLLRTFFDDNLVVINDNKKLIAHGLVARSNC